MIKTKYKVDEEQLKQLTEKELKSMAVNVTTLNKGIVFFKMVEILYLDEPITSKKTGIIKDEPTVIDKQLPNFDKMDLIEWLMYNFDNLQSYPVKDTKSHGLLSEIFYDDSYNVKTIHFKTEKLEWDEKWYQIDIDMMCNDFMWTRYVKLREEQLLYLINCKQRVKYNNLYVNDLQYKLENIPNEPCYQYYFKCNYKNIINQNNMDEYDDDISEMYLSDSDDNIEDDSDSSNDYHLPISSKFSI